MKNTLFKVAGPDSVRKVAADDGNPSFRLLSTRFGSAAKKDVHGEYFDDKTDFGDQFGVTVKFLMYDHHLNFLLNEEAEPSDLMIVGTAKFDGVDAEGRWYNVELDRSHKYHEMILKLQEAGLLGTSTQCYIGSKMVNPETGYISRWIESEVSLTPTPADSETIGKVYAIAKSVGLSIPNLEARIKAAAATSPAAGSAEDAVDDLENVDKAMETLITAPTSSEETPDDVPDNLVVALTEDGEVDMKALAVQLAEVHAILPTLKAWAEILLRIDGVLAPPEGGSNGDSSLNLPAVLQMLTSAVGGLKTGQMKQNKALIHFASHVVTDLNKAVNKTVQTQTRKAKLELDLETEETPEDVITKNTGQPKIFKSTIPDHAPGG